MYHPFRTTSHLGPSPSAAWTDYTPNGPWTDGQVVVRNIDGVGFTYSASLNALTVVANSSFIAKNANNYPINNLPAPTSGGDAANKTYVDGHAGGGGLADAPSDGFFYGRNNAAWVHVLGLGGGTLTGSLDLGTNLIHNVGAPTTGTDGATKGYVDTAVSGVAIPPPSTTVPGMDGTGAAGSATPYSRGDHVHPTDTTRAPLASPTFTGTPAAPTPTAGTNTAQIATTAFVETAIAGAAVPVPSSTPPGMDGTGSAGTATSYSRGDHIHPTDTSRAPLASPTFTGTPAAPTPASTDNSTTLATTGFVKAQGYIIANQTITLSGDVTGSGATAITATLATVNSNVGTFQGITVNGKGLVTGAVNMNYAPLASPTFTGTPAAPTATAGTNTTQVATTAFVAAAVSGIHGALITISDTAPTGAVAGNLWWNSTNGFLYVYYTDPDSSQWVVVTPLPDLTAYLQKSGDTMTGALTLSANPTTALGAATKQYVDNAISGISGGASITISDTAPTGVTAGALWWNSASGHLFVYYNDGDSSQWVIAEPMPDLSAYVQIFVQDTKPTAANPGSLWWNSTNAQLYVYYNDGNSSQWVVIVSAPAVPVMRSYLAGLILSTAGSSTSFSVAPGQAADRTNSSMMVLGTALTKTTAAWAAGSAGALDTGTIANNTWYHVHVIQNPITLAVDILISLSATAPMLPSGYTLFRRIGSMRTNASGQWIGFIQVGDKFWLSVPVADASALSVGTARSLLTVSAPASINAEVILNAAYNSPSTGTSLWFGPTFVQDTVPVFPGVFSIWNGVTTSTNTQGGQFFVTVDSSGQIAIRANAAGCTLNISTQGWIDRRGRDD